uniref:Pseudouridine synthase RsuA/RluA-like domain-containing protein n=1 Tax=Guillardia theta TaxID=55529 RepID=A0A7S4PJT6_GUITH|mmetsp:Transcript_52719/g.163588  ORF Transcript_52719/g.163588 Transcript_52719/m.163588 type:complete len:332 (+) Transcript_52719:61-1056(+)
MRPKSTSHVSLLLLLTLSTSEYSLQFCFPKLPNLVSSKRSIPDRLKQTHVYSFSHGNDIGAVNTNGTRTGFSIVKTFEIPAFDVKRDVLPRIQDTSNLLREFDEETSALSISLALHLFFQDDFPSMTSARKTVRRGEVLSADKQELGIKFYVAGAQTVLLQSRSMPGLFPQGVKPFDMPVVYEDDFIGVVVKPAGVLTHRNRGNSQGGTVKSGLAYNLKPTSCAHDALFRPVPCHRLDQGTGGIMLAAKTRSAAAEATNQFMTRKVEKEYVAIVAGRLEGSGTVELPLANQSACTAFYALKHARSLKYGWVTMVKALPKTGRKHQVYLANI